VRSNRSLFPFLTVNAKLGEPANPLMARGVDG
jgi:hypothetical protein